MIQVRNSIWETNSSSVHILTIGTNQDYEIPLPKMLIIRNIDVRNNIINVFYASSVQTRLDIVVSFIVSIESALTVVYLIHKLEEFLKEHGVETVAYDWESFYKEDYSIIWGFADELFEMDNSWDIILKFLTNSKSIAASVSDYREREIANIIGEPNSELIFRDHE